MAPLTFHLLRTSDSSTLLSSLRSLPKANRPLYVGQTHHWIHEPTLSTDALLGPGPSPTAWDYLLVCPSSGADGLALPSDIPASAIAEKWSLAAPVDDTAWLANYAANHTRRLTSTPPALPPGWSPTDHSGLDASTPPTDLSASLALSSRPLGEPDARDLKAFARDFGTRHAGPMAMFNLLAYTPAGGREKYFGYIQAFQASTGIKYGGEPLFHGAGVTAWTSGTGGQGDGAGWDDCALVWYPSLWHFSKMLDDPGYAAADREFKTGSLRDNPLICCTEIEVEYVD